MAKIDVERELQKAQAALLLPVERRLVVWSFGVGLMLLVLLALLNRSVLVG